MCRRVVAIVTCLVGSLSGAEAGISVSLSQTTIPVGGSVSLTVTDAFVPLPLSGLAWLQSIYPPNSQIFISADDFAATGFIDYSAPGSQELSGGTNFTFTSWGQIDSSQVFFTYPKPGQYQIDFSYNITESESLIGAVLNAAGDALIAGPDLPNPPSGFETGLGQFTIQVNSVPELSTSAMLLIGFVGMGFLLRQRKNKNRERFV